VNPNGAASDVHFDYGLNLLRDVNDWFKCWIRDIGR